MEELINRKEGMTKQGLIAAIEKEIGQGGNLSFEHGYKRPIITCKGIKCAVTMITPSYLHCHVIGLKTLYLIDIQHLRREQLLYIIKEINKYYNYCKYFA